MISDFFESYPEIEVDIIGHDEQLDVKAREADVSIRPFTSDHPDLIQDYLFSCFLQLYASPEYLKKYGTPQKEKDLDKHRIITFGETTIRPYANIDWPLRIGTEPQTIRKPFLSINS